MHIVCVYVCERERERERERPRERVHVCERESVCMWERESVSVLCECLCDEGWQYSMLWGSSFISNFVHEHFWLIYFL